MSKKINFKEFDKPELIEALEVFMSVNLLPSMESHLMRKMSSSHLNRLTDERNSLAIKLRGLLDKKRKTPLIKAQIQRLFKQLEVKDRAREKRLKKMLQLEFLSQEDYDNLTLLHK